MKIVIAAILFFVAIAEKLEDGPRDSRSLEKPGTVHKDQQQDIHSSEVEAKESDSRQSDSELREHPQKDNIKKDEEGKEELKQKKPKGGDSDNKDMSKYEDLVGRKESVSKKSEVASQDRISLDPNTVFRIEIKIKKRNKEPRGESSFSDESSTLFEKKESYSDDQKHEEEDTSETGHLDDKDTNTQGESSYTIRKYRKSSPVHSASQVKTTSKLDVRPSPLTVSKEKTLSHTSPRDIKEHSTVLKPPQKAQPIVPLQNFEGGMSVLCIITKNIDLVKSKIRYKSALSKITNILVYRDQDKRIRDYWGRLFFKEANGRYVDETGFYEGRPVSGVDEILEKGKLTKNGFYQSKDTSTEELEKGFETSKFLIAEIAKERKVSIRDILNEECGLSFVDRVIFSKHYTASPQPVKKSVVCICVDSFCKEPCRDIRSVDPKKLE